MSPATRAIQDLGLSDAEVTKLLDELDACEVEPRASERRSNRHPFRGTALVVKMSLPGFTTADFCVRLRNISRHGVAFLSRHAFEPGAKLSLELPIGQHLEIVERQAVVVRNRQVGDQVYEVGAEFSVVLY